MCNVDVQKSAPFCILFESFLHSGITARHNYEAQNIVSYPGPEEHPAVSARSASLSAINFKWCMPAKRLLHGDNLVNTISAWAITESTFIPQLFFSPHLARPLLWSMLSSLLLSLFLLYNMLSTVKAVHELPTYSAHELTAKIHIGTLPYSHPYLCHKVQHPSLCLAKKKKKPSKTFKQTICSEILCNKDEY